MEKTCFFIGHRDAQESVFPGLAHAVEQHIVDNGVSTFIVGRYGRFDGMAARAVKEAKKRHAEVHLLYLRPYHPAERPDETPDGFDGSLYPPGMERVPRRLAIVRANRYMVDHCDFLIAYAYRPGNSRKLLEYARRREQRGFMQVTAIE